MSTKTVNDVENLLAAIATSIGVIQVVWSIVFPRIAKALGYLNFPIVREAALDSFLTKAEKQSGLSAYTHRIVVDYFGSDSLNTDDVVRHPIVTYDERVEILCIKPTDAREIWPQIEYRPHGFTLIARWNPHDKYIAEVVLASQHHPKHPHITARILSSREFDSRLLSARIMAWIFTRLTRILLLTIVIGIAIFVLPIITNTTTSQNAPSIADVIKSTILWFFVGGALGFFSILPLVVIENLLIAIRARYFSKRLAKELLKQHIDIRRRSNKEEIEQHQ